MRCCGDKKEGCCCVPISNLVCVFLFHLTVHGAVVAIYVLTTLILTPLELVDYFFAYMGIALSVTSFLTMMTVRMKKCQPIRGFLGFLAVLAIAGNFAGTFWYTIMRWKTKKTTLILVAISHRMFHTDPLWYIWIILCWVVAIMSLYYVICILSCMCQKYKTYLFTSEYQHPFDETRPDTAIEVKRYEDRYANMNYKPYPTQKL